MPRTARIDIPGLFQHVIVRGIDGYALFRDDNDRQRFLRNLSRLLIETGTDCFSWSLMTNHVHLLLHPRLTCLAPLMRRLLTGYAIYYNLRHKRTGHLFQNRYKSIVCDEDNYLLELIRYIHLNPLRAGIVADLTELDDYPWSGHSVLMDKGSLEGQVVDDVLAFFSQYKTTARNHYHQFIFDGVTQGKRDDLSSSGRRQTDLATDAYDARILGNCEFIEEIQTRKELAPLFTPAISISKLIHRVSNYFTVAPERLKQRTRAPGVAEARSIICYLAVRQLGYNGAEIGRRLGISRSGVSVAVNRGELLMKSKPKYLAIID